MPFNVIAKIEKFVNVNVNLTTLFFYVDYNYSHVKCDII